MLIEIGHVEAIFRYPVKSMGGERLEIAKLGWHGLEGDRRLAFRRIDDRGGFPWLTASKLPDLLLFAPHRREEGAQGDLPTHIRTPDGKEMPVFGEDLAKEVGRRSNFYNNGGSNFLPRRRSLRTWRRALISSDKTCAGIPMGNCSSNLPRKMLRPSWMALDE
jgi:uncharacterized protein YcbX